VHQPMGRQRRIPGEGLVDALGRLAVFVEQQVFRAARKPRCGPAAASTVGLTSPTLPCRPWPACWRLGVGRLEAEAAGAIDGAEQDLQHVQSRGRSGSRWNGPRCRAWRASRRAGRSSCRASPRGRSRAGRVRLPRSKAAWAISPASRTDGVGRDATVRGHRLGRVVAGQVALCAISSNTGTGTPPARQLEPAFQRRHVPALSEAGRLAAHFAASTSGLPSRRARKGRDVPVLGRSPARARWCSGSGNRDRSCRPEQLVDARRTNSPSVPGVMPTHSSAMRCSRCAPG
jgi:hypothetical protein